MNLWESIPFDKNFLYEDGYNYQGFKQRLYFQKSFLKTNGKIQYFFKSYIMLKDAPVCQGYIYFYLDSDLKSSDFIGAYVKPEYRNSGLASLLVSHWIQFCLNNGYNFLGTNKSQRKPFLLYLLKTYGFEILDESIYNTSANKISICKSDDDNTKYLLFQNPAQRDSFINGKIAKEDNYHIISELSGNIRCLDKVILSQIYNLSDTTKADEKSSLVIKRYHN